MGDKETWTEEETPHHSSQEISSFEQVYRNASPQAERIESANGARHSKGMMFAEGKSISTERNFIDNILILWYYFSNH